MVNKFIEIINNKFGHTKFSLVSNGFKVVLNVVCLE